MSKKSPQWKSDFPSKGDKRGNIAKNVQFLREEMGILRPDLAEYVDLSVTAITKIENSDTENPGMHSMDRIADFFGVSMKELMYSDVSKSSPLRRTTRRLLWLDDELKARAGDEVAPTHIGLMANLDNIVLGYAKQGFFRKN